MLIPSQHIFVVIFKNYRLPILSMQNCVNTEEIILAYTEHYFLPISSLYKFGGFAEAL